MLRRWLSTESVRDVVGMDTYSFGDWRTLFPLALASGPHDAVIGCNSWCLLTYHQSETASGPGQCWSLPGQLASVPSVGF